MNADRPATIETGDVQDGLPTPQRYWSALAIWLAIALTVLDSSVANVALPTIAREFAVPPQDAIWVVNAYQIAIVVSLLPLASLGEILGYRRVYLTGLAIFIAASIACSLSTSLGELIAARVAQGLGGAGVMSINAALVRFTYPSRSLGRAIGYNALVVSIASAAGPSLSAAILSAASWPWLFALNIPIGIATFGVAAWALPRVLPINRRFDYPAAILNAAAFGLVIGGVDLATRSARPALGSVLGILGLGCFVLLGLRGRGQASPLLPIDLMRIPIFALSVVTSICSFCAQMLAFVALPFLFDRVLHRSPGESGLLLSPWPVAVGIAAPLAGALADRMPAALLSGAGLTVMAIGLAILALLPVDAGFVHIAIPMALCGAGFGFFQAPNNRTLVTAAPRDRAGAAGGMLATARLTGQTAGATMLAVFFALRPDGAERFSLAVAAGLALAGAVASASRTFARPGSG